MYHQSSDTFSEAPALDLLPFYVYELRDPRDGAVFYVGKGKGQRVWHHSDAEESEKGRRLEAIKAAGHEDAIRVVVARFESEAEAFAVESILIKWVYGFGALTNRVHGHRHASIRGAEQKAAQMFDVLPGIDVPRRLNVHDGTYTENQRALIARHGILEKMEAIRDDLRDRADLAGLSVGDPDLRKPQDPIISIAGFSDNMVMVVKMQLTGKNVVIGLNPKSKEHVPGFDREIMQIREPFEKRNGAPFGYAHVQDYRRREAGFPKGIPVEHTDIMAEHILRALARLADRV